MREIYVVVDEHGEYSEHVHENVCAFAEKEQAEAYAAVLNAEITARQAYNNKATELWNAYSRGDTGDPRPVYVSYEESRDKDNDWYERAHNWVDARMTELDPVHSKVRHASAIWIDTDHSYHVEVVAWGWQTIVLP